MRKASPYNSTSVRAIILRADRILVEWLESKGVAFLPGGTVEQGEELLEALKRELSEEIEGADFTVGRYRGTIGHSWTESNGSNSCLNHFYEVKLSPQSKPTARTGSVSQVDISLRSSGATPTAPKFKGSDH